VLWTKPENIEYEHHVVFSDVFLKDVKKILIKFGITKKNYKQFITQLEKIERINQPLNFNRNTDELGLGEDKISGTFDQLSISLERHSSSSSVRISETDS